MTVQHHNKAGNGFYSQKDVDHAWDKFLCSGGNARGLPVRDLIANSWERCLTQGVNPARLAAPLLASEGALHKLRVQNADLLGCARPVLEQAQILLRDLETVLFLTDYEGVNLHIVGDPRTVEDAEGIGLVPGCGWQETISGSNAVGTAMATRKPTQVHGEEHFCQGFKPWTCTAAIIGDPYDNQMIGVIDVSGLRNVFDKFHVPLVVAWASEIQTSLAKMVSEQWNHIEQVSNNRFNSYSNSGKLLFDTQGRLVNYSEKARAALQALRVDYDPLSKNRLSFERFGGKKLIYPHNSGDWISEEWVEPICDKNEILGYQLVIPTTNRRQPIHPIAAITKSSLTSDPFAQLLGKSSSIKFSADKARKAAATPLPVLILGETGVGKEVFAKAIHESSHYANGPFIDLNCGAFSKDILNSELFGHIEGAFTGARKGGMMGEIEAANGGTLFLDEIGEMPLELQPIFLRVLQERKIYRVGDIRPIPVDFRLIAATNSNLKNDISVGRFRKDLFFRLSTVTISLDPLSGRKEDIEGITKLVMERVSQSHSIVPKHISPALIKELKNREWPGNIRELVNVVECMCFMSQNETLTADDLPDGYKPGESLLSPEPAFYERSEPIGSLDLAEAHTIENAIKQSNGNMTQAAKSLGIAKSTLYQKTKKYGTSKYGA